MGEHNAGRAGKPPFVLVAVPDGFGVTPLDLAVAAGNHAKAKLMTEAYARAANDGAWRAASTLLACTLKTTCRLFPDLMVALLEAAHFDAAQNCTAGRLSRANLPAFRPHCLFRGVDWFEEFPVMRGGDATGQPEGVEVTAHVAGMCGMLARDGPFNAVAGTGNVKAFATRAMAAAVEYKWRTYGRWVRSAQLLVYLTGVTLFFGAKISVAVGRYGLRMLGDEHPQQGGGGGAAPGLMRRRRPRSRCCCSPRWPR